MREFDFTLMIKRESWDYRDGVTPATVQERLKALTEYFDWVHREGGWIARNHLFLSKELVEQVEAKLKQEIDYCKFYLELQERRKEADFDKWVFHKKEELPPSWDVQGDQWIRANGRIKAIVEIDHSGKMTAISVKFRNDSTTLRFMDDYYGQPKIQPSHAKNPQSITEKIEEYKRYADNFLKEHQYPQYNGEARSFTLLKQILCIEEP